MLYRKIFSFSLLLLLITGLCAVNENAGTTGFNNLKIVYSARAISMAGAMTGMGKTVEGLQFNPAGILGLEKVNVSSTFCSYFEGSNGGALHLVYPKAENVSYGIMLHYLNSGEMDRTEVTSGNEYLETGETFGASNLILGVSAARIMNPSIDVGITGKLIYDKIDSYSAAAILVDAGLIHHPVNEKITVGISLRNLGKQVAYYTSEEYSEGLPMTFAAGLSYAFRPQLSGAFDINVPRGANMNARFGLDFNPHPMLNLRMGYNSNSADWKTGGDWDWSSGLTFGAGFKWKEYKLDYGIASYGNLGFVNQVSLNYSF